MRKTSQSIAGDVVWPGLLIAAGLYLLMRKTGNFGKDELLRAFADLLESDRLLKSSAQHPKVVLERLIMRLCGVDSHRP